MDKLGIHTVGANDTSVHFYNIGMGFHALTGTIKLSASDCLLMLTTADRNYALSADGDIVLVVEEKSNGVTPFNFDWTDEAKAFGFGRGTIIITNPECEDSISILEVEMTDYASIDINMDNCSGVRGRMDIPQDADVGALDRHMKKLLTAALGNSGKEISMTTRDFDQLVRTRDHDLERILTNVAAATVLEIDVSHVDSRRTEALALLDCMSDRFSSGGKHPVSEDEVAIIGKVFGELYGIGDELAKCVSHWHHYQGHLRIHESWVARLPGRSRCVKVADGEEANTILSGYIPYASNPDAALTESTTAFEELFAAVKRGDLGAAHRHDQKARFFTTREHFLDSLIRRGKLVPVATDGIAA